MTFKNKIKKLPVKQLVSVTAVQVAGVHVKFGHLVDPGQPGYPLPPVLVSVPSPPADSAACNCGRNEKEHQQKFHSCQCELK